MKQALFAASVIVLSIFAGCKENGQGSGNAITVKEVFINKTSVTLQEGDSETLNAVVIPVEATNKEVTWSVSDPNVASVDASGVVSALKAGSAVITVTTSDGSKTATCTLTVTAAPVIDPEEEKPVSKGAYKHIVILGVDGGGSFFRDAYTPSMDDIFRKGSVSYRTKTSYPTISAQCWGSMLHSVLPEFHRLTNGSLSNKPFDLNSPYPSIFRIVRDAYPSAKMASFCNWNPINEGIIEETLGVVKNTGTDPEVAALAVDCILKDNPTLLFVQFDSVDGAGHGSGYGSSNHLSAITAVDELIGKIYKAIKDSGILEETLFIVTADHGGTPEGTHGGDTDAERYVFLGVTGKTVEQGGEIKGAEVRDVAAIAAYALGLDFPATWTGIVPGGLFKGVEAMERKEMELPVSENRKHETEKTPDPGEVESLLSAHKIVAYLPLDGDANDAFGKVETVTTGKLYFHDAYYGIGPDMSDGYITLKDVKMGNDSFSVAFWMKTGGVSSDPCIISNKDWNSGANDGFVLSLREDGDIKFNAGRKSGSIRMDVSATMPHDYKAGWMHVVLAVDRINNKVSIYYDFTLECSVDIPSSLVSVPFDALDLNIGQDGTGKYAKKLAAQLDEVIITADVLDGYDIGRLKAYYK